MLELYDHVASHLTSEEWRRCALHQIEILQLRLKATEDELKLWQDELTKSNEAIKGPYLKH